MPSHPAPSAESPADLQQRIRDLEHALEAQAGAAAELRRQNELLQAVLDEVPYAIYWKDTQLTYRGCNRRFAADLALDSPEAIVGKADRDLPWQPDELAAFEAADRKVLATEAVIYDDGETVIHPDGTQEWFETYKLPLHDTGGALVGIIATYNNITARKRAEATVRSQALLLQELSTPVIPLTDEVLVMPLVGAIDTARAQQILTTALERIAGSRAQALILDITGVPLIDTHVAHALIQTSQAMRLLGAHLVLTGIRPEVAQALVGLGVELREMVTYSTLQHGLVHLLRSTAAQPGHSHGR